MKVLVIGGTKFIGPYLVKNLLELGHEVMVFHRGKSNNHLANVAQILGERCNLGQFINQFRIFQPDVVVDMIPFTEKDAKEVIDVFRSISKRVVAISSGDVYFSYDVIIKNEMGPIDNSPVSEKSNLRSNLFPYRNKGNNDYDKIPMEKVILNNKHLHGTVLRLPVVYGPNDEQHRIFNFLKRMNDKRPFILVEEGFSNFRWTHGYVEDVAHAITLAVVNDVAEGKVYNVGQLNTMTMFEWIEQIGKVFNWNGKVIRVSPENLPQNLRFDDLNTAQNLIYDTSLIRLELGFKEVVSLEEALSRTIQWGKLHPKADYNINDFNYEVEDEILLSMK